MKIIYLPLLLVMSLVVSSCDTGEPDQTITIEQRYSLTIPSFLSKSDYLHDEASLQYQNLFNEFYVVVIDEPKNELHKVLTEYNLTDTYSNDIDGYSKLVFDGLNEGMIDSQQTEIVETNVNGMPTRLTTIEGTVDDLQVFYTYGIYEGEATYYQVIAWTLSDRQSKYRPRMDSLLQTLKELKTNRKKGIDVKKKSKTST